MAVVTNPRIYISRRALKHFVERRKSEMLDKYSEQNIILRLYFAIENVNLVVSTTDFYEEKDKRFIYSKYFTREFKFSLRIVVERIENHLEIVSMHYKRAQDGNKKATM